MNIKDQQLLTASKNGNHQAAKEAIDSGADVDAVSEKGTSALMYAAMNGHKSVVELLVERGANINLITNTSALLSASGFGQLDVVEYLLKNGADINQACNGATALTRATAMGKQEIVKLLVDTGARDTSGRKGDRIMANEMDRADSLQPINIRPRPPAVRAPHATEEGRAAILEYYGKRDWEELESFCNIGISSFVKGLPSPILSDSTVYNFHFGAIAYKNLGKTDKYHACLKVLFSLDDYGEHLSSEDHELLDSDIEKYRTLSKEVGTDRLNDIQVAEVLKKSGCFIATAVYGSPYADEVIILKEFRDNWLLNNGLGKVLVRFYYWISPPIANQIAKRQYLRSFAKSALIIFVINIAKHLKRKGQ